MEDESHRVCTQPPSRFRVGWRTVLLRVWLASSISSFSVALVFVAVDHDNPLRSDDPYIVGGIAAGFCAVFALFAGIAEVFVASPMKRCLIFFGPVVASSVFFVSVDLVFPGGEGHGISTFFGVAVALSGAAAYPLAMLRLTRAFIICASIPGLLYLLGLGTACIVMGNRGFLERSVVHPSEVMNRG